MLQSIVNVSASFPNSLRAGLCVNPPYTPHCWALDRSVNSFVQVS